MAYKELAQYIMEQLSSLDDVRNIPMMGGYIFYYKERIFGGIYGGGKFFVKITEASQKFLPNAEAKPPYDGAKPMIFADDIIDDRENFAQMVKNMYAQLPERSKKKSPKKR